MNYLEAFRQTVARTPDAIAVRSPDTRAVTYATLDERTDRVAAALDERIPGGRIATLLEGRLPMLENLLGAVKRGQAVVPLNIRESPDSLASMVEESEAKAIVFDAENVETAVDLLERTDLSVVLTVGDVSIKDRVSGLDVGAYEAALNGADPTAARRTGSEFAVTFTSGSTGRPKGVLVGGERLWYASSQTLMEMDLRPDDVGLVVTPLFHLVTPKSWVFPHLQTGATVILQARYEPDGAIEAMIKHDVTGVLAVPAQLDALVDAAVQREGLQTLRHLRTGGGPLGDATCERVREHLTPNVHNTYGLTEGISNVTHAYPRMQDEAPGTVGRASFNWRVRVVETVGPDVPPDPDAVIDRGERGEVLARSAVMADGYLNRPEADAELFVDGWLRTGDIAIVDEHGYLHVVDRVDDMIVTGGENVYPTEVERVLEEHPDIVEVGVVGVPDDRWGEAVFAVVVSSQDLRIEDIDSWCKAHDGLADFKRPRRYAFASELPRSPTGTLRRGVIRERWA